MNRLIIFWCLLSFISCKSTSDVNDSTSIMEDGSVNLYAFIGKKISVKEFDLKNLESFEVDSITGDTLKYFHVVMDQAFNAKYKVLKNVFNKILSDTINFVDFDHYGKPAFRKPRYVLLYISFDKKAGTYYHQKYQFDPVKKINRNKWTGLNGESLEELINNKKKEVLKARGLFK